MGWVLLKLLWNDELFVQTKWCSAIKRAESTQVSCVTLMVCLWSIYLSFSLSGCLSAVWLCRALGWAAAPGPRCSWSGGTCGYAAKPDTHHYTRHRFYSAHGLRHLAPGNLQWWKRNWNCLLPHHSHRWVPQPWPTVVTPFAICIIPIIPTSSIQQQTFEIWGMSQTQFSIAKKSAG